MGLGSMPLKPNQGGAIKAERPERTANTDLIAFKRVPAAGLEK